MRKTVLETKDICKSFYNNEVLKNVNFCCHEGEVHTLVGENGAGKSTLMKIVSGVYQPTSGEFLVNGEVQSFENTRVAQKAGVGIIHQEFNLVPYMTVYENMFLGRQLVTKAGNLDTKEMRRQTKELAEKLEVDLDPNALVKDLTVAQQQMLEIMKAISLDTQIIIMDEPTAALTSVEVGALFKMIDRLRDEGRTIIYISHRLNEVFEISDYVTVLKDGATIATTRIEDTTKEEVVNQMVGRELGDAYPERDFPVFDKEVLQVKDMVLNEGQEGISFSLKAGEILGITGLEGQGQRELLRSLFGLYAPVSGEILLDGKAVDMSTPMKAMKHGVSFLTDDRKEEGLCLDLEIYSNIALPIISKLKKNGIILRSYERKEAQKYMESMNIRATSSSQRVQTLSGGNQQKVLLGKCLSSQPRILLVHESTRGIDVGAKMEIYELLKELARKENIAIVMVSSDLLEIINVCDRVLVIYDGKINGEMAGVDATEESIMRMATDVEAR